MTTERSITELEQSRVDLLSEIEKLEATVSRESNPGTQFDLRMRILDLSKELLQTEREIEEIGATTKDRELYFLIEKAIDILREHNIHGSGVILGAEDTELIRHALDLAQMSLEKD